MRQHIWSGLLIVVAGVITAEYAAGQLGFDESKIHNDYCWRSGSATWKVLPGKACSSLPGLSTHILP